MGYENVKKKKKKQTEHTIMNAVNRKMISDLLCSVRYHFDEQKQRKRRRKISSRRRAISLPSNKVFEISSFKVLCFSLSSTAVKRMCWQ